MNDKFSTLSINLTKKINSKEKKKNGIYFTPKNIIIDMIEVCKKNKKKVNRILEPCCGSCQVINELDKVYENIEIDGIEYNNIIFDEIKELNYKNKVNFINTDYLKYNSGNKYDLIIGNPPYFVISKKSVESEYYNYFNGRPNIFVLFIIKAMKELSKNGILAFVLPKNFLNCNYYNKIRIFINEHFKILDIKDHSDVKYIDTCQDTITMIIKNRNKVINKLYTLKFNENMIFNTRENIKKLRKYYKNATTLKEMNFEVKVGNVVWNQVKDKLTNDENDTRLIYSSDIIDNKLDMKTYSNPEKKNFIDKEGNTDLLLVVNRGYGKGKYKFSYCLIDTDKKYLVENHLICIKNVEELERNILLEKYKLIINSLKSKNTEKFIELYCGNNALNTRELAEVIPIYIKMINMKNEIQKPFLKWVGGKTQIIDKVMNIFPSKMNNYHELFLGGGSVLLALLSLQKNKKIIIKHKIYAYDINNILINVYKNIQNNKDELFKYIENYKTVYENIDILKGTRKPLSLEEAKSSKESYYYWLRKKYNNIDKNSIECSALFIFINKTCFRGMYREGPNGFNVPFGHYKKTPTIISKKNLDYISDLIKNVHFIHADFETSIKNVKSKDFVYLDPPYAPEKEESFVGYVVGGFDLNKHMALFSEIKKLDKKNVKFVMSNAKVDLVVNNFKDYSCKDIIAKRAINSKKPGSKTTEVLIYN
tara:strand:+ start:2365 stop:4485 length:2121 start_codon:yes stop_codon:yes gene_type:complete